MDEPADETLGRHQRYADAVRAAVIRPPANGRSARTDAALRSAVAARSSGGPAIAQPYDDLARQIGEAANRVTDAQLDAVRTELGSDRAAFEIVMAASIGAGLARWDAAVRAIEGADGASG